MLTEPNCEMAESEFSGCFSADMFIREEIQHMRGDIEKIQDRLENFENKLIELSRQRVKPKVANESDLLIGPRINHSLIDELKSERKYEHTSNALPQNGLAKSSPKAEQDKVEGAAEVDRFFDQYNHPEVSDLKKQLEDKLKKAEVEMSIQRARVFQQKAELEGMKLQLEQREAAIRKSIDAQDDEDPSKRWDRHLNFLRKK